MKTKNKTFTFIPRIFKGKQNSSQPSLVREGVNFSLKGVSAFTLVELIIVITILAILATIAFISFQNYTKDARDGNRVTTLSTLQKGLELYSVKTGIYPTPEELYASGYINTNDVLLEVGYIKDSISRSINFSKTPTDPVSGDNYVYGVSHDKKYYQIATTLENLQAYVVGNYKGIIKKGDTLSNPASLIISYTGSKDLITTNTYFVEDKLQNLPYKLTATTILTGGEAKPTTSTGITHLKTHWSTLSGSIQEIFPGIPTDTLGVIVFGEKEYFSSVKNGGSTGGSGGSEPPTTPTYTITNCPTANNAQNNTTPTRETILEEIGNYIGCDASGQQGKIAGITYSGSISEENKMILLVATSDATSRVWQSPTSDLTLPNITGDRVNNGNMISAWDGLANTQIIQNWLNANSQTNMAALECNLSNGWYLPAIEELTQLYCYGNTAQTSHSYYGNVSRGSNCVRYNSSTDKRGTLSNFTFNYYYSSTEVDTGHSRGQGFSNGNRSGNSKNGTYAVRCVSRF